MKERDRKEFTANCNKYRALDAGHGARAAISETPEPPKPVKAKDPEPPAKPEIRSPSSEELLARLMDRIELFEKRLTEKSIDEPTKRAGTINITTPDPTAAVGIGHAGGPSVGHEQGDQPSGEPTGKSVGSQQPDSAGAHKPSQPDSSSVTNADQSSTKPEAAVSAPVPVAPVPAPAPIAPAPVAPIKRVIAINGRWF